MISNNIVGDGYPVGFDTHWIVKHEATLEVAKSLCCKDFLTPLTIHALDTTLSVNRRRGGAGSCASGDWWNAAVAA